MEGVFATSLMTLTVSQSHRRKLIIQRTEECFKPVLGFPGEVNWSFSGLCGV